MRYSDRGMPYEDLAEYRAWEEAPSPKRGGKTVKTLLSVCMILLLLASLALLYIRQYTVTGASMEPTLMEGDRVFYVGFTKPDYGDLIIFDAGETYGLVIKRVVGLPAPTACEGMRETTSAVAVVPPPPTAVMRTMP